MKQTHKSLVGLLGLAVVGGGLAGAAVWSTRHDAAKKKADEKAAQLFTFKADQVTALTVQAKGDTTVLTKDKSGWRITQPISAPADASAVEGLLANLSSLRSARTLDGAGGDLAKYGLAKPATAVTATYPGGTASVSLGDTNDFSGGQYAVVGGKASPLLLEGTHPVLAKSSFELRDKRLLIFDGAEVAKLQIDASPDAYTLERDGARWKVTAPREEKADDAAVSRILGALSNLKATAVASEAATDLKPFGLEVPQATVTLTLKSGKQVVLKLGQGSDKKMFAQASTQPLVAEVPSSAAAPLHVSLDALQDKTIARVARDQVAAVQLTTPKGDKLLIQRKTTSSDAGASVQTWVQLSPKSGAVPRWKASSLLYTFANLRGTQVVGQAPADLAKFGLDKPTREVTLQDTTGKALADVIFGKVDGANTYAKAKDDPRIFELLASRLSDLPNAPDDLLEKKTATAAKR